MIIQIKIVKESWARGVQWELTRIVYTNYKAPYGPLPDYTLVVIDLIDNENQNNNAILNDGVDGYSIRQIEDALRGHLTWENWKSTIKNLYENDTENKLDALFDAWN